MRVAIAGAGIAGLTAALALARRGLQVELFERAPALDEVGAGIQLTPNAMKVLARLEVADALAPTLTEPRAIAIGNGTSGKPLAEITLGDVARRRYGAPYALIHRADLQSALLAAARREAAITLHLRAEVHDVRAAENGVIVRAAGQSIRSDVLVAADGIDSRLRVAFFQRPPPRPLHRTAWRTAIPVSDVPQNLPRDVVGLWLGRGAHLVHYPVRNGALLNVVAIGSRDSLASLRESFGSHARALIDATSGWTPWQLFVHDCSLPWVRGRAALIGDAAHAMAPSAAQGGAQAIEDAYVLASCLAADRVNPTLALESYQKARLGRVQRVARESSRNLTIYELGSVPARLRDTVLSRLPAKFLLGRMDWLFGWQADEKTH